MADQIEDTSVGSSTVILSITQHDEMQNNLVDTPSESREQIERHNMTIILPSHMRSVNEDPSAETDVTQNDSQPQQSELPTEDNPADSFDKLILDNFSPFSGSGDAFKWLDEREAKFDAHRISQSRRLLAIPLLVIHTAKQRSTANRKQLHSTHTDRVSKHNTFSNPAAKAYSTLSL